MLQELRNATRQHHNHLEQRLNLLREDLDLQDYLRLLQAFYGFYQPFEEGFHSLPAGITSGLDLDQRRKTPRLEQDLAALGMNPSAMEQLPRCGTVPDLVPPDRALGCLYVLEGATLGGQVLQRGLCARLGLDPEHGCAFFSSYGAEVGRMWREFGAFVERECRAPACRDAAKEGAVETFVALDGWLTRELHLQ